MMNQWIQGYHSFRQPKMVFLVSKPKWVIEATLGMHPGNKIQDAWDQKKRPSRKSHLRCVMLIYFDPWGYLDIFMLIPTFLRRWDMSALFLVQKRQIELWTAETAPPSTKPVTARWILPGFSGCTRPEVDWALEVVVGVLLLGDVPRFQDV